MAGRPRTDIFHRHMLPRVAYVSARKQQGGGGGGTTDGDGIAEEDEAGGGERLD